MAVAGSAMAAGILPPNNPGSNLTWGAPRCDATGNATPNMTTACMAAGVAQINAARAVEGVGPIYLPSNYLSLSGAQQQFVVANLERVDRGIPAIAGMDDELNAASQQGAGHGADPPFVSNHSWAGAVWAGGYSSVLEADFAWMYSDGPGSSNEACVNPSDAGCWGHRDIILASAPGMTAGAATGYGTWGTEYAMEFVQLTGAVGPLTYTWAQAVAAGAGVAGANSVVAAATPAPVRPAGWQTPTRLAGADREATAIAVSQHSWSNRSAGGVVIARDDQFPDALAAVPLAASVHAPILLTPSAGLDPRDLAEVQRVLPTGSTVYLIGGGNALSPAVGDVLSGAGYRVNRIAGNDRFGTAVAIADAIGDPGTVFEVNGDTFADALAAGPAAAASHGAVLLTDGANMPSATGDYLANHAQKSWAIGGPAAVADPSASPIVGADRYETASMVAFQFIPSPNMIGVATGQAFPDALAAGSAIAHAGGALLLVNPNSVPDPTAAYINAHTTVPMLLYGGVNAVTSLLSSIL